MRRLYAALPARLRALAWRLALAPMNTSPFRQRVLELVEERMRQPVIYGDPSRVTVEDWLALGNATLNVYSGRITIGQYTFLGQNVSILAGTHDPLKLGADRRPHPTRGCDIVIGEGVWIAANATILGPCTIGDHAVIAAGAVVRDDVPAAAIVAGVPARRIGHIPI